MQNDIQTKPEKVTNQEISFNALNNFYLDKKTNQIKKGDPDLDLIFNIIAYNEKLYTQMTNNQIEPYAIAHEALFRQANNFIALEADGKYKATSDHVTAWLEKYVKDSPPLAETVKYINKHRELCLEAVKSDPIERKCQILSRNNGSQRIDDIMGIADKMDENKKSISPIEEYKHHAKKLFKDTDFPLTKIDEKAVAKLLIQGYKTAEIKRAITEASPIAAVRDKTYAQTLVNQIAKKPEIQKAIKEIIKEAGR